MVKPLVIELFCGSFGWSRGFLEEGFQAIGFDIEHEPHHGPVPDGAELVLQDVLTLHGAQFKDATCIVASPPCQDYSYLAMPWSRSADIVRPCGDGWEVLNSASAKEMREHWEREGPDNRLFDACFRIQREASAAAGRYIPMIVENVRGAIPWVGRSAWNHGSFHLWGDVPALMPINLKRSMKRNPDGVSDGQKTQGGSWFRERNGEAQPGIRHEDRGQKIPVYSDPRRNGGKGSHPTCPSENIEKLIEGTTIGGDWFSDPKSTCRKHGSRSSARKAASASIAKIPPVLARHIASVFRPRSVSA